MIMMFYGRLFVPCFISFKIMFSGASGRFWSQKEMLNSEELFELWKVRNRIYRKVWIWKSIILVGNNCRKLCYQKRRTFWTIRKTLLPNGLHPLRPPEFPGHVGRVTDTDLLQRTPQTRLSPRTWSPWPGLSDF